MRNYAELCENILELSGAILQASGVSSEAREGAYFLRHSDSRNKAQKSTPGALDTIVRHGFFWRSRKWPREPARRTRKKRRFSHNFELSPPGNLGVATLTSPNSCEANEASTERQSVICSPGQLRRWGRPGGPSDLRRRRTAGDTPTPQVEEMEMACDEGPVAASPGHFPHGAV